MLKILSADHLAFRAPACSSQPTGTTLQARFSSGIFPSLCCWTTLALLNQKTTKKKSHLNKPLHPQFLNHIRSSKHAELSAKQAVFLFG